MIYINIYTVENCATCDRVVNSAKLLITNLPNVILDVKDIKELDKSMAIVPAIFINQNLFCYGDFDSNRLLKYIKRFNSRRK